MPKRQLVCTNFAEVMEQRNNRQLSITVVHILSGLHDGAQSVIHIQAVRQQSSLTIHMKLRAGRSCKEISLLQPANKFIWQPIRQFFMTDFPESSLHFIQLVRVKIHFSHSLV
jgi:hypothetical protein